MKRFLKFTAKLSVLSACALAPILLSSGNASAEPKGMDANYIGAGISAGVTNGGQQNDAATFGGTVQGRFAIPKTPISLRGAVQFSDQTSTIMPIITYDVPVARNTNAYIGAGYGFHEAADGTQPTSFGNKDAPVIAVGVERKLMKDIVIFSDAKLGIQPYQNSTASSVSLQLGAGYRF